MTSEALTVKSDIYFGHTGLELHKDDAQARKELWEVHHLADPLVSVLFSDLPLIWKRTNDVALPVRSLKSSGAMDLAQVPPELR